MSSNGVESENRGIWARVRGFPRRCPRVFVTLVFLLGIGGGIAVVYEWRSYQRPHFKLPPPSEYVYLDPARTIAYLSQLQGGFANSQTVTQVNQISAKLAAAASIGNGEVALQRTNTIRTELLTTLQSQIYTLRNDINQHTWGNLFNLARPATRSSLKPWRGSFQRYFEKRHDGEMVFFVGCRLETPLYIQIYDAIRRSPAARTMQDRRFLAELGPNPLVPFRCGELPGYSVLVAAEYSQLLSPPWLLQGSVALFGKVAFISPLDMKKGYIDTRLLFSIDLVLRHLSPSFLRELTSPVYHFGAALGHRSPQQEKSYLIQNANLSMRLAGRSIVVLPVAIYK